MTDGWMLDGWMEVMDSGMDGWLMMKRVHVDRRWVDEYIVGWVINKLMDG